jgi:ATP-dependent Clp protease protease subunit
MPMPVNSELQVPYNIPGSNQWQWVSIGQRMAQERILFLNQPLTTNLANSLISSLLYLESEDQTKPIYLYINSIGDPVLAGMDERSGMMAFSSWIRSHKCGHAILENTKNYEINDNISIYTNMLYDF